VTSAAYFAALAARDRIGIFELAIRFAFSGFAALAPVMLAALFWRRSTKWGALAATLWVAATLAVTWYLHEISAGLTPAPGQPPAPIVASLGDLFQRTRGGVTVFGLLPVVPMVAGSALLMWLVSLATPPPSRATIERYFPPAG
jgi:Na+/proline symporter